MILLRCRNVPKYGPQGLRLVILRFLGNVWAGREPMLCPSATAHISKCAHTTRTGLKK